MILAGFNYCSHGVAPILAQEARKAEMTEIERSVEREKEEEEEEEAGEEETVMGSSSFPRFRAMACLLPSWFVEHN